MIRRITCVLLTVILAIVILSCSKEPDGCDKIPMPLGCYPEIKNMVVIPAVKDFQVGSDAFPPLEHHSIETFAIAPCETTQGLYQAVMGTHPSKGKTDPAQPVQNVTWEEAVRFCNSLSKRLGVQPCYDEQRGFVLDRHANGFRLPLSCEWEYACRGDGIEAYFWGADREQGVKYCVPPITQNEHRRMDHLNVSRAKPVMTRQPSPTGLYDMAGNVSEWCGDTFSSSPGYRVIRGGSWEHFDWIAFESKWSSGMKASDHMPSVGFRIVRNARSDRK